MIYLAKVNENTEAELAALVCEERRAYARKYRFERDRKLSLGVAALLNAAVAMEYPHLPQPLTLIHGENEQPELVLDDVRSIPYFSLSHAGDYVAAALADSPVGIDLEVKEKKGEKIAARYFTAAEQEMEFHTVWTMRESFLKCCGLGLQLDFRDFHIERDRQERLCVAQERFPATYYVRAMEAPAGYALSVCMSASAALQKLTEHGTIPMYLGQKEG